MNRRSQGSLPLSKAIAGFLQYKAAEGLSPNTLQSYQRDLKLWQIYAGDVPVDNLTTKLIQDYFVWLRTDYQAASPERRPPSSGGEDDPQLLYQPLRFLHLGQP